MRVDFRGSERHFIDHLAPVWHALPAELRGRFYVAPDLVDVALELGVEARSLVAFANERALPPSNRPLYVVAYGDFRRSSRRRTILGQHGAGQSYSSRHTSYPGGRGLEAAAGFLVPNEQAAARFRRYYPRHPIVVVGCPRLDGFDGSLRPRRSTVPVVAVSFHWACRVSIEAGTAWPDLGETVLDELVALRAAGEVELIGHGHPRIIDELRPHYERRRIPVLERFSDVVAAADVYLVDNSSTAYEAAAMGLSVVLVNSPRWRRTVEHGLRFWTAAGLGPHVNAAADVAPAVRRALEPDAELVRSRSAALVVAYSRLDHQASRKAASAIMGIFNSSLGACPLCGAARCSCGGPTGETITVIDSPRSATMAKQGPVKIYKTSAGDFRLNEADARRRGLLPDGDRLPPAIARRLRLEGRLTGEELATAVKSYAKLTDEERAVFLTEFALVAPRQVRAAVLEARDTGELEEFLGADDDPDEEEQEDPDAPPVDDPPAPAEAPPAVELDAAALLEGRVGDVTDALKRIEDTEGPEVAKAAAAQLLEAEQAGKARTSLVAELERRAG